MTNKIEQIRIDLKMFPNNENSELTTQQTKVYDGGKHVRVQQQLKHFM